MYTYPYLKKRGVSIFKDGNQILVGKGKNYKRNFTTIDIGESLVYESKKYNVSYTFLRQRGFIIAEKDIQGHKYYFICKPNPKLYEVGQIPKEHNIKYDNTERAFKLEGKKIHPDFDGWIYIDKIEEKKEEAFNYNYLFSQKPDAEPETYTIKLPCIGTSLEGEIVCFPMMDDAPVVALIGRRGSAKTLAVHRIKDEFIEKDYARIIELNDMKDDTITYCEEWNQGEFISDELSYINEISKPMPMLFLTLMNDKITEETVIKYENQINFKISLPMKEILADDKVFEKFDLWELGKSLKYFKQLIKEEDSGELRKDGLTSFDKVSQMKRYVEWMGGSKEFPKNSCTLISGVLQNMWDTRTWDISNGITAKWEVKIKDETYETYPWVAGLVGGLSVSLFSGNWIEEEYSPFIYRFILDSIFKEKKRIPALKNKHIIISSDEIHYLTKKKEGVEIINEKNKIARSMGGGMLMVTQSSSDLISDIKDNVTHYMLFRNSSKDPQIEKELKDYPELKKALPHLKMRECIMTGDLWLIDPVSGRKYSNQGRPIFMRVLPPKSRHKPPEGAK